MKLLNILKACLNYKVIIAVILIIIGLYLFVPRLANFSWILLVLICPLSMVLMMSTMQHSEKSSGQEKITDLNIDKKE